MRRLSIYILTAVCAGWIPVRLAVPGAPGPGRVVTAAETPKPRAEEDPAPDAPAETPEEIERKARSRFALLAESRSLFWDYGAIQEFASTQGIEVVPAMLAELRKAQPKGLQNRAHLLASAVAYRARGQRDGSRLLDSEATVLLEFARKELRGPADIWPAFNVALALAGRPTEWAGIEKVLLDASRPAAIRAALLLGLAEGGEASVLEKVRPLLAEAKETRNRGEQARLREAVAWAAAKLCATSLRREGSGGAGGASRRASGEDAEEDDGESIAEAWGIPRDATKQGAASETPDEAPPESPGEVAARSGPSARPGGPSRATGDSRLTALRCMEAVRDLLDEKALGPRTRLQVMRALQHAWGTELAYESAESWKQVAADGERSAAGEPARTGVRFFGIPSSGGRRVLFLLDGSDSMLTLLTPAEKDALEALLDEEKEGGEEGVGAVDPGGKGAKGTGAQAPPSRGTTSVGPGGGAGPAGIDGRTWGAVSTRFDAARAHLVHTLSLMAADVEFAVVLFGTEAEPLKTTPSFLKATETNRGRVVQELGAIVPGPRDAAHPNGALRGETNLYDALSLGLALGAAGRAPAPAEGGSRSSTGVRAPVSASPSTEGCADTIYLLSDGIPTRDGFGGRAPLREDGGYWMPACPAQEGEREVVINPETGATRKEKYRIPAGPKTYVPKTKVSVMDQTGPYIFQEPLAEELRRRNLFVRATVHVVAIGEAGTWLCTELARVGGGQCLRISPSGQRERLTPGAPGSPGR